ncbi:exosortase A [Thiorhodococcus mannitoliphagus]|uniref:Exosortase A n=1 Tax=Thiorhodococcus mannitoliphagus TaxID=329406 RepID=A0A6P1DVR2_9GAMM|nr:exosortase A [Thiorhodococcus mannitoliphagus]NEX19735.1 exosortase A [Thiorhodococcus mannitoliphagus]
MLMRTRLLWGGLSILILGALFWPTFASMVSIWERSETFAHGFVVLPIALYLVWRERSGLGSIPYRADWRALPFVAINGFAWLLARLADVLVIEQLAAVVMIPILVWLIFGLAALRYLAFPLGFLFFAVPMGEELVYPLMQFTASFTVGMLRLSGIPVYWEGTFFSIPSGDWSVVTACSGIRYLIASLFLGVLFAYLNYRSLWRRLVFVAASIVVPILANGLRAYLIVMLGHLSGMRLAVGVDHLIYGWVFFGLVMFILFAVGNIWSERGLEEKVATTPTPPVGTARLSSRATVGEWPVVLFGLALLAVWPLLGMLTESRAEADPQWPAFEIPAGQAGWRAMDERLTDWSPRYMGMSEESRRDFARLDDQVGVYLALYRQAGGEMVNSENLLVVEKDPVWRQFERSTRTLRLADRKLTVTEARLGSSSQGLLVWSWYWVDGHETNRSHFAKIQEVLALLSGRPRNEALIVLYTPIDLKTEPARQRLQDFTEEMLPLLDASLRNPSGRTRND